MNDPHTMKLKKKPKVRSMRAIEDELWRLCRLICHKRDANNQDQVFCYTSGKGPLEGQNKQLGHGYPKGALGASMKYDLRILRWQSYNENINLGGNGATFWKNLERDLGKKEADKLYLECVSSKGKPVKARDFYTELIERYKAMV